MNKSFLSVSLAFLWLHKNWNKLVDMVYVDKQNLTPNNDFRSDSSQF